MDVREQVDFIFTDFRKAFDKVDHLLLLQKLAFNGIRGNLLRWFISYLTNRTQIIVVNGFKSMETEVTSGVIQGSILGPLLYIMFINDIKMCFQNCHFVMFADDLKIYKTIKDDNDCKLFQSDLDFFYNYCQRNKLQLAVDNLY